jgi:hypothetical protein
MYSCGSEYDAIIKAGLVVSFYHLTPRMEVDLDHVASLCQEPAALLYVTHYFGFPQPMDPILAFAASRGMRVIEDCAMALYSKDEKGRALGSIGDAGIFSFLKTIPLPDGSAVVCNRALPGGSSIEHPSSSRPAIRPVLGSLKHQAEQRALMRAPWLTRQAKRIVDPLIHATRSVDAPHAPPETADKQSDGYRRAIMGLIELKRSRSSWVMSPVARHLFDRTRHDLIPLQRRRNYELLQRWLPDIPGIRPMFPKLRDGCCPLFYPLIVDDPDPFHRHLVARGIETKRTWSYFHDDMLSIPSRFETWLKMHVISLPTHDQLGEEEMRYMSEALEAWRDGAARKVTGRFAPADRSELKAVVSTDDQERVTSSSVDP